MNTGIMNTPAMNTDADLLSFAQFLEQFDAGQQAGLKEAICEEFGLRGYALDQAVANGNSGEIRDQAHGVKGTAATFQLTELSDFASQIESRARQGAVDAGTLMKSVTALAHALRLYTGFIEPGTGVATTG